MVICKNKGFVSSIKFIQNFYYKYMIYNNLGRFEVCITQTTARPETWTASLQHLTLEHAKVISSSNSRKKLVVRDLMRRMYSNFFKVKCCPPPRSISGRSYFKMFVENFISKDTAVTRFASRYIVKVVQN